MNDQINKIIASKHPVVLFDGVCNLCNGFIQWIIKRDPQAQFRFASLQSPLGLALIEHFDLPKELGTVILVENKKAYTHSNVPLRMSKGLGFPWSILYVFTIIPKFIRDFIYNIIATNRYRWFGKQTECMIPTPDIQNRFL